MTKAEAKWSALVGEWRASGETSKSFAARRGCKAGTLTWWAWHLNAKKGSAPKRMQWVRWTPKATTSSELTLEVSGVRIVVREGFDASMLGSVVRALREAK